MKKTIILILLATMWMPFSLWAQINNVIVETYYVSDSNDAADSTNYFSDSTYSVRVLPVGSKTYRVYIELKPGSRLKRIYGDANHTLKISSTEFFFNNIDRPAAYFGYKINKAWFSSNPTLALDSWLTLGLAEQTHSGVLKVNDNDGSLIGGTGLLHNTDASAGIPLTDADGFAPANILNPTWIDNGFRDNFTGGTDTTIFGSVNSGSSFISNTAYLQQNTGMVGAAADSNKVLAAQLTTLGELSFELNVVVTEPDGASTKDVKYVAKLAAGESNSDTLKISPYLSYPLACGCTDPNFLEFSSAYSCNNPDSCRTRIIFGCMDVFACNYDANANFNIVSLCCYPGYCNDRDLNVVCPALSIKQVQVYPNPAKNQITLQISTDNSQEARYAIYDCLGRIMLEKNISLNSGTSLLNTDISALNTGVYMLRIFKEDGTIEKMFMKN